MKRSANWKLLNRRIRAAEKARGMGTDDHAALVARVTNSRTDSLGGCGERDLAAVLAEIEKVKLRPNAAKRAWKPSPHPHVRKVFAAWRAAREAGAIDAKDHRAALRRFCVRMTKSDALPNGVGDPNFLSAAQARPIIEGIKAMTARAVRHKRAAGGCRTGKAEG